MLIDKQNMFSNAQAITATANSTDKVDLQGGTPAFTTDTLGNTVPRDPGKSPELEIVAQVVEAFSGGTSVAVSVVADDDPALGSPTTLHSTPAIAVATLKAGYQFRIALPAGIASADRYLGLVYTVVGTPSAGKISAWLAPPMGKQTAPGTML